MYIDNYNKISKPEDKQSSNTSEPENLDNMLLNSGNEPQANFSTNSALNEVKGDLNNDGKVDSEDIKILKDFLEGKRDLNDE